MSSLFKSKICLNIFFLQNKSALELQFFNIFLNHYKFLYNTQFKCIIFFVKSFLILLVFKDLNFFKNWFCNFFELISARLHRKFLLQLNKLFKLFLKHILLYFGCSGFKLVISGKISVTGNSKKRRYFLTVGSTSYTKKKLKLLYAQGTVRTLTGVLGIIFMLSYV